MEVELADGETDTVRLLGVDTPETTLGDVSPDEYEGFSENQAARDHLFNWGVCRGGQHKLRELLL